MEPKRPKVKVRNPDLAVLQQGRTPPSERQWDEVSIRILAGVHSLRFLSALLTNDPDAADVPDIGSLVDMVADRLEELAHFKGDTFSEWLSRQGVA